MTSGDICRLSRVSVALILMGFPVFAAADDIPAESKAAGPSIATEQTTGAASSRTIYFARNASSQNLVQLLERHYDGDANIKLYADAGSNILSIRAGSPMALDEVLKTLALIDRPSRQVIVHFQLIELNMKKPDAPEGGNATLPVNPEELNGPFSDAQAKLKSWMADRHVASIRRYELKGLENVALQLSLSEQKPVVSSYNTNAVTRAFHPNVTYRDFGTVIDLITRITDGGKIELALKFDLRQLAAPERGTELIRSDDKTLTAPATSTHRLNSTLSIPDGHASVAACAQDDVAVGTSPLFFLIAPQVIDPNQPVPVAAVDYTTPYREPLTPTTQAGSRPSTVTLPAANERAERIPTQAFGRMSLRRSLTNRSILQESKNNNELAQRLKLTDEQQKKLQAILSSFEETSRDLKWTFDQSDASTNQMKEVYQQTLDILNEEQKKVWTEHQQRSGLLPMAPSFNPQGAPRRQRPGPQSDTPET